MAYLIFGGVIFKEEALASRRAAVGLFILEDLKMKKALEEKNIRIERLAGERDVRLTLPDDWSLIQTGRLDRRLHYICNPKMEPVFVTFSAHLTELTAKGWIKHVEDCPWLSGDNSIVLGSKVNIKPLEVDKKFVDAPSYYPYHGLYFWEKAPGVVFLCNEDKKPIGELCAVYNDTFVRRRKNEEAYHIGPVVTVEDKEEDYRPDGTHKYSPADGDYVCIEKLHLLKADAAGSYGSLKKFCTSTIVKDERLVHQYSEPGKLPTVLKKQIDILILSGQVRGYMYGSVEPYNT